MVSPGKRALDSELEASDVLDEIDAAHEAPVLRGGTAVAATAVGRKGIHMAKRMTVRGGNEEDAPQSDAALAAGEDTMDEALYNRQLYVFGHDAMKKMQQSNILLIGLAGL